MRVAYNELYKISLKSNDGTEREFTVIAEEKDDKGAVTDRWVAVEDDCGNLLGFAKV